MALDQLPQFMRAIGTIESGNNYSATGPYTGSRYGRARGRYQIMETIYGGWAREAGVNSNDLSPEAQDRVARHKMSQYYRRYGSWPLVAVAWFAGPGRADKAAKAGISSVGRIPDMLGTTVASYVKKAMNAMGSGGSQTERGGRLVEGHDADVLSQPNEQGVAEAEPEMSEDEKFVAAEQMGNDTMANIITSISDAASAQGGKEIDLSSLFGSVLEDVEAEDELIEEVS